MEDDLKKKMEDDLKKIKIKDYLNFIFLNQNDDDLKEKGRQPQKNDINKEISTSEHRFVICEVNVFICYGVKKTGANMLTNLEGLCFSCEMDTLYFLQFYSIYSSLKINE